MDVRQRIKATAYGAGRSATHGMRTQLYGTRYTPNRNASDALNHMSAIGVGPRSVWTGPRVQRTGAPIVKRDQPG